MPFIFFFSNVLVSAVLAEFALTVLRETIAHTLLSDWFISDLSWYMAESAIITEFAVSSLKVAANFLLLHHWLTVVSV